MAPGKRFSQDRDRPTWRPYFDAAIAFLTVIAALGAWGAACDASDAAQESNQINTSLEALAKADSAASRTPLLADVPLGEPYDKPQIVTGYQRYKAGGRGVRIPIGGPGEIVIMARRAATREPCGLQAGPTRLRLRAIAIPVQNIGQGAAKITGASVQASSPYLPTGAGAAGLNFFVPVLLAPGQSRIFATADLVTPGSKMDPATNIGCVIANPRDAVVTARFTYSRLDGGDERMLSLQIAKPPGSNATWQVVASG